LARIAYYRNSLSLTARRPGRTFVRCAAGRARLASRTFPAAFEDTCMSPTLSITPEPFIDRRNNDAGVVGPGTERRQFSNSHQELSPDARELAMAIDGSQL